MPYEVFVNEDQFKKRSCGEFDHKSEAWAVYNYEVQQNPDKVVELWGPDGLIAESR